MKQNARKSNLSLLSEAVHFFAPKSHKIDLDTANTTDKNIAVIVPTHGPIHATYNLISSILVWNENAYVVVVDDCTPENKTHLRNLTKIRLLAASHKRVVYLRTQTNELKAGALNYGIDYIMSLKKQPDAIVTFDDDVVINKDTIPYMIAHLFADAEVGAVCSEARVINKNANVLTRLQALEYHGFNITKVSDNGFIKGPLVMQGMSTAFKMEAVQEVKAFSERHLIEDYEITARLKTKGWKVKIAQGAIAWTHVPETIENVWRQRIRWIIGGLYVVRQYAKNFSSVYQDAVGHILFLSLFLLVIASIFIGYSGDTNPILIAWLLGVAIFNFILTFIFNIVFLTFYKEADWKDWVVKLAVVPELIYNNLLTLILLGSYVFVLYIAAIKPLAEKIARLQKAYDWGLGAFNKAGFNTNWGTK